MNILYNPKLFNPLYWHLKPLLRDEKIRYIFIEGGSSAGKTFTTCQALLIDMMEYDYSAMIFRRQGVDIKDSIYSSFEMAANSIEAKGSIFTFQEHLIKSNINGARVRFRGLDDEENVKGIEKFNVVYNNEWSQFLERHFDQQRKRLRGRANQKFICDWNPISSKLWQYEKWIDLDTWQDLPLDIEGAPTKYSSLNSEFAFKRINQKGDAVWLKVTYRDNWWIVGHPIGKGGFIDQHVLDDFERDRVLNPNQYRIYANGERGIMRTGGEFWKQFNEITHVKQLNYEPNTIHISCDQNNDPYVTVSIWQIIEKDLRQIHELPCRAPDNNAVKSALKTIRYLKSISHEDTVFVYGDPSANSRSSVDENNRSFFDKYIAELKNAGYHVVSRVGKSHPQVSLSADFVNDIYENNLYGYSIAIGDNCTVSIDDYVAVKSNPDGSMLKVKVKDKVTGITYEPYGHFSDAKRYFITQALFADFNIYKSKSRKMLTYIRA